MPDAQGNALPGDPGYAPNSNGLLQAPAPQQATASAPTATAFEVTPNSTVASNVKGIIDADSPLMQQAASRAAGQMNARGLLNSSQAISAGQSAVYDAALPIATADAATYARASENTTAAKNAAELQRSNITTSTSQFNANATNAQELAASQNQSQVLQQNIQSDTQLRGIDKQTAAAKIQTDSDNAARAAIAQLQADTSMSTTDKQLASQKILTDADNAARAAIAQLQSGTSLTLADKQAAAQKAITDADNAARAAVAQLQANTTLTGLDRQLASQKVIDDADNAARAMIVDLQANTSLTLADKQAAAQKILSDADNAARAAIAHLQADTSLTATQKQIAANEIISAREDQTKTVMQRFQLDADLQKINADGSVRVQLADVEATYKVLMQTSAGAADLYKQALTNFSSIVGNPDIADKTTALNNGVKQLNDALSLIGEIGNMDLGSYITFDPIAGAVSPTTQAAVAAAANAPSARQTALLNMMANPTNMRGTFMYKDPFSGQVITLQQAQALARGG